MDYSRNYDQLNENVKEFVDDTARKFDLDPEYLWEKVQDTSLENYQDFVFDVAMAFEGVK